MLKRLPLLWSLERGYHIDAPTYQMVRDSFVPEKKGLIHKNGILPIANHNDVMKLAPTVLVELPDDYIDPRTDKISARRIREIYRGHPIWGDKAKSYAHIIDAPDE